MPSTNAQATYPPSWLQAYAIQTANSYGIPDTYFLNMIQAESNWDPYAVSNKGAQGIVQIIPKYHPAAGDPFDPYSAIDYAGGTIKSYYNQFGNWDDAFAAWNAGTGNVQKYGGVPPFAETQNYVNKITGGTGSGSTPSGAIPSLSLPGTSIEAASSAQIGFFVGIGLLMFGILGLGKRHG